MITIVFISPHHRPTVRYLLFFKRKLLFFQTKSSQWAINHYNISHSVSRKLGINSDNGKFLSTALHIPRRYFHFEWASGPFADGVPSWNAHIAFLALFDLPFVPHSRYNFLRIVTWENIFAGFIIVVAYHFEWFTLQRYDTYTNVQL